MSTNKDILLKIDVKLKEDVRKIAKKMGLSISAYIRMNLSQLVEEYDRTHLNEIENNND